MIITLFSPWGPVRAPLDRSEQGASTALTRLSSSNLSHKIPAPSVPHNEAREGIRDHGKVTRKRGA